MATCDEMTPLLGAFEDGELEPNEMREVARHIAQCANCERGAAEIGNLGRMLRSAAPQVDFERFGALTRARIDQIRPSVWTRVTRRVDEFSDRVAAAISIGAVAVAAAALTVIFITPYARKMVHEEMASAQTASTLQSLPATVAQDVARAADSSKAEISRLESSSPAVAVWSEPRYDTTVIWVPDQP